MHTCLRDDNLTIWMVHKAIWGLGWLGNPIKTALATVPEEEYTIPFGKARTWREGTDVTLVGYGITVHHALTAAAQLEKEGISAHVLDLRSIVPLDREAIFQAAAKTGRVVVADEDYMNCGVTAEVLAVIAEKDPSVLKKPAVRIAYPDVPVPFSRPMEDFCLPLPDKIASAARSLLR
jgi:pyruvate dehydrogenase E1 component beta subunit